MTKAARLHKERMIQRKSVGYSVTDKFWAFHREISRKFLEKGWLFMGLLEADSQLVAFQYAFRYFDKVYHYQTGIDTEYNRYSIGLISTGCMIEASINESAIEYDFLRGGEDYKSHWSKSERNIVSVYVWNSRHARAQISCLAFFLLQWIKKTIGHSRNTYLPPK
jgi:CelD/BcsL family acetyltransferase involved in cellulose biosynthesis